MEPKHKRRNQVFLALFIAVIMVSSIFGLFNSNGDSGATYKGNTFVQAQNGWLAYVGNKPIYLLYSPDELANVSAPAVDFSAYSKIYISLDPNKKDERALYDFEYNLKEYLPLRNFACYEDIPGCEELPLKDCADASLSVLVMKMEESNTTEALYENNCLVLKGDITKLIDKILLQTFFP